MAVVFLTFPWSFGVVLLLGWSLAHDTKNPVYILIFAGCVVLNAYLIRRHEIVFIRKPK